VNPKVFEWIIIGLLILSSLMLFWQSR
jgi:hypothetical protein